MSRPTPPHDPQLRALERAFEGGDPAAFGALLADLGRPVQGPPLQALLALGERAAAAGGRWSTRAALALSLVQEDAQDPMLEARALGALEALGQSGVPPLLGGYALGHVLGVGGMGEVRRAWHLGSGVEVAVKLLSAEAMASDSARRSLRAEVRAVASLDHPHVVALLDYGVVTPAAAALSGNKLIADSPYLVIELAHGGTLRPYCGRLAWPECQQLLLSLLDALGHAHARDLVHRDLKPDNVLVDDPRDLRRGARLTDFGLASVIGERSSGRVAGTPAYMAPEQLRGAWREVGPWTDLYALGCLATALVTGLPPFGEGEIDQVMRAQLVDAPPPMQLSVRAPQGFEAWCRRLLEKAPADRFQRAADAAWVLRHLDETELVGVDAPPARAGGGEAATFSFNLQLLASEPPAPRGLPASALPVPPVDWRAALAAPLPAALRGAGIAALTAAEPPLVARELERDQLWAAVRAERAELVLLRGKPGLGRTRLGTWLLRQAHASGAGFTVHLSAGEGGTRMPRSQYRWQGLHGFELMEAVRREMAAVGVENPLLVAAFAELMEPGVSGVDFGGPEQRLQVGFAAMLRYTRGRRLVIFIDDAHEEPELIELVASVAGSPLPVTVLMSLAARGPEDPSTRLFEGLRGREGVQLLDLAPLAEAELRALLSRGVGLDPGLAARVAERCAGNPQHALSLVAALARERKLVEGPEGLELRDLDPQELPRALQDAWKARLEPLVHDIGAGGEDTLALAALLGGRLELPAWRLACEAAQVPGPEAVAHRLVDEGLASEDAEGGLKLHSLGMVESLVRGAERRGRLSTLHAACATALGRRDAARGRHLLSAGRGDEAAELFLRSARQLKERSEHARALSVLRRVDQALELAGAAPGDPRRLEAEALRGAALLGLGRHAEALALTRRALVHRGPARPELLRQRAVALTGLGQLDEAERAFREAQRAAELAQDGDTEGLALYGLADLRARLGRLSEAREGMDAARRCMQGSGLSTEPWVATVTSASLALQAGDLPAADRALWEGRAGLVRIGSPALRAWLRVVEAQRARLGGEPEAAAGALREARQLAHAVGSGVAALADLESARLLLELGRHADARESLLALDQLAQARGRRTLRVEVLALLGVTELLLGDEAAALAALDALEPLLEQTRVAHPFVAEALEWAAAESQGRTAARFAAAAGWVRGRVL